MRPHIFQESFPRVLVQLIEEPVVFLYEQVGDDESSQALGLGKPVVQVLQTVIGDGEKNGRLEGLDDGAAGCPVKKGKLAMNDMSFRGQLHGQLHIPDRNVFPHYAPGDDVQVSLHLSRIDDLDLFVKFPDLDIRQKNVELLLAELDEPRQIIVQSI